MSNSASERLARLFNFLRDTGTDLPCSNATCAQILVDALDTFVSDDDAPNVLTTIENLRLDLEVMVEELRFQEDDTVSDIPAGDDKED